MKKEHIHFKWLTFFFLWISYLHSSPPPLVYNSVNVITGEYCETNCDLTLPGPFSLNILRSYCSDTPLSQWKFNHPNIFQNDPNVFDGSLYSNSLVLYEYDQYKRLSTIKVADLNGHTTFHEVNLHYSNSLKNPTCTLSSQNGKQIIYHFRSAGPIPNAPPFVLEKIVGSNNQTITYQYCDHPKDRRKLISRKEGPNGQFLITHYDNEGRVASQLAPLGTDKTPILKHRFHYYSNYTIVEDATGNQVLYRHNGNHLTAIEHLVNSKPYRKELFFWSDETASADLTSKMVVDSQGNTCSGQAFTYDSHHNIIEEMLFGNLTGNSQIPIVLNANGAAIENGFERYITRYTYQKEAPYLLLSTVEDNGITTHYQYLENSQLPTAKLIEVNGEIQLRNFFFYDPNFQLIKTMIDDGEGLKSTDLAGVTERHITTYALRYHAPAIGTPEIVEERYLDLNSGKERLKRKIHNHYSEQGYLTQQEVYNSDNTICSTETYAYDALGRKILHFDHLGQKIESLYDANNNLIFHSQTDCEGKLKTVSSTYDHANRLIRIETTENEQTLIKAYQYDFVGNRVSEVDPSGNITRYVYDNLGRLIQTLYPEVLNSENEPIQPLEERQYDVFGNVTLITNANHHKIEKQYNCRNKPIAIAYPDGSHENLEYFLDGTLSKAIMKDGSSMHYQTDFLARVTQNSRYDSKQQLINQSSRKYNSFHLVNSTEHERRKIHYNYAPNGKCLSRRIEDCEGNKHLNEYSYDAQGHLAQEKCWFGQGANDFTLLINQRDESGKIMETQLQDASGHILKSEIKSKSPTSKTFHDYYFQNSRGQHVQQITSTDKHGRITATTLDALGRIESIHKRNALGHLIASQEMRYDAVGNKVRETHSLISQGKSTHLYTLLWEYDHLNQIIASTEAANTHQQAITRYQYNASGKLESKIKPDGNILTYTYDTLGRLESLSDSKNTLHYQYTYDLNDNIIAVEDLLAKCKTTRTYNSNKQVLSETLSTGVTLSKEYDAQSRPLKFILPDSSGVAYEYNAAYLTAIHRLSQQNEICYSHHYKERNSSGRLLKSDLLNNLGSVTHIYDSQGRLTTSTTPWTTQSILEYDPQNQILATSTQDTFGALHSQYAYDEREQLIQENDTTYTYDSLFNRIDEKEHPFVINARNQLVEAKDIHYTYDANGCLIEKTDHRETVKYGYDALNRLTEVQTKERKIQYTYDAFGRRLTKTTLQGNQKHSVNYLYDGHHEIGAISDEGEILELRILGEGLGAEIGATIAIELKKHLYVPTHDIQGSICALIDAETAQPIEWYRHNAFGEPSQMSSNEPINPWRFSAKRFDADTGLIAFGQRDYDPSIGRWTTPDPLEFIDGPNQYAYLLNNPLNLHDLWGHFSFSDIWDNFLQDCYNFYNTVINLQSFKDRDFHQEIKSDAELLLGTSFLYMTGYYKGVAASGIYGNGEVSDKVRITALNGVLNLREHWIASIETLSKTHGGVNIHYVFNPSEGWTGDALQGLLAKCGFGNESTRLLASNWKKLIKEMGGIEGGGMIFHYAHSMGGTHTAIARDLLTPEEQKMIKVITIGSPTLIPNGGFASVVNYMSQRDFAGFFDPVTYIQSMFSASNVVHLGSLLGAPLVDHLLTMETYARLLEMLGEQFQQAHGTPM